ncbi:MAG: choice-of-anchor L domain-containing protein [Bacteroidota bacterium]
MSCFRQFAQRTQLSGLLVLISCFCKFARRTQLSFLFLLSSFLYVNAQLEVINEFPYDPDNLVETVFVGEGVTVLNVDYEGDQSSAAFFKGGLPFIGMDRGIVMTTGRSVDENNPNVSISGVGDAQASTTLSSEWLEDPDIRAIVGGTNSNPRIQDIVSYTITFQPVSDSVNFRYVFASEEYPEYVCSPYNDIFGFFISGPGINGPFSNNSINIAQIPGTDLPVRINSVNPGIPGGSSQGGMCDEPGSSLDYSNLYIDNNNSNSPPIYDGFTQVFDASVNLQACETYTIKLILADIGDGIFDSAVFLEARSFSGEGTNLEIANLSIDGTLVEGCSGAELNFFTPNALDADLDLEVEFFGTATEGADYTMPPMDLTIPAGDSLLVVPVEAFEDGIADGGEEILISLRRSDCRTDTFTIRIEESQLESLALPNDQIVCGDDQVSLSAQVVGPGPTNYSFSSNEEINLTFLGGWRESEIEVSGVVPEILSEETFVSVCIDELDHNRPAQIDAFLISPTGVLVELTTDNGGAGNNNATDGYFNTCFRPDATTRIAAPGQQAPANLVPFTGDWLPEGELSDLWFGDQPANGTWTLRVRDDAALTNGELRGWSINFQRPYELNYEWSSEVAAIDCPSCPDTEASAFGEGSVRLRVTDSYGCQLEDSLQLEFPDLPSFSPPVCDVATENSISIDWGDAPEALFYEVSTDGINWTPVGNSSQFTLEGLNFETATTILVRGQFDDCAGPAFPVTCTTLPCVPPSIETNIISTCAGGISSTVELTGSGGELPYSYFVDGVEDADGIFDGLAEGDYIFTLADNRGCSDSVEINIVNPPAFDGELEEVETVDCNGFETGQLAAVPIGGEGPFTYEWNGESGDSTLTNLGAGDYQLVMRDANGCVYTEAFEITEPEALDFTAITTNQNCDGSVNGTASVFMSGGTPDYSYAWNAPGQGDVEMATGLPAGDYVVSVTDANNCELVIDVSVGMEPDVQLVGNSIDATCFGQNSGSISTTVNIGLAPLNYQWSGPVVPNGSDASNLPAGVYELTVTDARNCQYDTSFTITQPTEISVVSEIEDVNCAGQSSGTISLTTSGGVGPYTYEWSDESNDEDRTDISAGNYNLLLTDANGCIYEQNFLVGEEPAIELTFDVTPVDCPDASTGSLTTSIENGQGPFVFDWSNGGDEPDQDGLPAGRYELEVIDANGCATTSVVEIPTPPSFVVDFVTEPVRCNGGADGLIEMDLSGGTPGYRFRLNEQSWQRPNSFIGLLPGTYTLEAEDANGCRVQLDGLVIAEPDPFELDLGEDQNIRWGDSVLLFPDIFGGTLPAGRYEWSPADSSLLSCLDCPETWASPLVQTSVRLRVFDAVGCIAEDVVTIFVEKAFPVQVPTGFTPNGDSRNDLLVVHGQPGVEILEFQIFDRWGEQVYQNSDFVVNDLTIGWDGSYRDQPMNGGVFIWQLVALLPDGSEAEFRGQTTLIR